MRSTASARALGPRSKARSTMRTSPRMSPVIPGRGRLSDTADVASYRNMMVMVRDRVQDLINKGMTLDQVKAAKPTMDFDGRYGSTAGSWTTSMFIEAVYKSLKDKK